MNVMWFNLTQAGVQPLVVLAEQSFLLNLLLPAGLTLIVASLFMWGRKKRASPRRAETTAREQFHQMKEERAVRGDLEQIMVEIEQLAKRMSAQLDSKAVRLERLLQEADAKIAELEQAQQGERGQRDADMSSAWQARQSLPSRTGMGDAANDAARDEPELAASVYRLADAGMSPLEIAQQLNEHVGKVELVLALRQG